MTDEERKAWEGMVAIRKSFYKTYGYYDVSDEDPVILAADAEIKRLNALVDVLMTKADVALKEYIDKEILRAKAGREG